MSHNILRYQVPEAVKQPPFLLKDVSQRLGTEIQLHQFEISRDQRLEVPSSLTQKYPPFAKLEKRASSKKSITASGKDNLREEAEVVITFLQQKQVPTP